MIALLATLAAICFGVSLGWIARGEHAKRQAVRRVRATLAANRDKLKATR